MTEATTWRGWTPEAVDMLRKLYGEGVSFGSIGSRVGRTRNAVIGKANRMGLGGRSIDDNREKRKLQRAERKLRATQTGRPLSEAQAQEHKRVSAKPKNNNPLGWGGAKPKRSSIKPPVAEALPPEPVVTVEPLRVPLVDLLANDCHWPVNDGGPFLYCAHPALHGEPYCRFHAVLAYREPYKRESIARLERIARA